jgi:S1-C subfamily serine protease
MRRTLLAAVIVLALACPALATTGWTAVAARVAAASARVEHAGRTVCSAFSIDEQRGLFMTAYHCLGEALTLDGHIAWTVYAHRDLDLAVLETRGVRKPALVPGPAAVVGQPIAAFGWGYGLNEPLFRTGVVSAVGLVIPELSGAWLTTDFSLVGGQSGGAMVDAEGRVISINLMGSSAVGLGRSITDILAATAPFWP